MRAKKHFIVAAIVGFVVLGCETVPEPEDRDDTLLVFQIVFEHEYSYTTEASTDDESGLRLMNQQRSGPHNLERYLMLLSQENGEQTAIYSGAIGVDDVDSYLYVDEETGIWFGMSRSKPIPFSTRALPPGDYELSDVTEQTRDAAVFVGGPPILVEIERGSVSNLGVLRLVREAIDDEVAEYTWIREGGFDAVRQDFASAWGTSLWLTMPWKNISEVPDSQ